MGLINYIECARSICNVVNIIYMKSIIKYNINK